MTGVVCTAEDRVELALFEDCDEGDEFWEWTADTPFACALLEPDSEIVVEARGEIDSAVELDSGIVSIDCVPVD